MKHYNQILSTLTPPPPHPHWLILESRGVIGGGTCTSMEVVSSTTRFITARTLRGSMVFTQSRVSTLFLSIWEMIKPWTWIRNRDQDQVRMRIKIRNRIRIRVRIWFRTSIRIRIRITDTDLKGMSDHQPKRALSCDALEFYSQTQMYY